MQMPREIGTFHIIGIGGIGMSAIAEILHAKGYSVQGSDQKDSANVRRLRAKGIRVFVGPRSGQPRRRPLRRHLDRGEVRQPRAGGGARQGPARHPPRRDAGRADAALLDRVRHRHARQDDDDLAHRPHLHRGRSRSDRDHRRHHQRLGLERAPRQGRVDDRRGRRDPTAPSCKTADRRSASSPTSIPEHLDYFKTVENMHREFETFFRNIPFYGLAVTCIDHPVARDMIERLELRRDGRRLLTYGTTRGADLMLRGAALRARLHRHRRRARRPRARRRARDPRLGACRSSASTTRSNALAAIAACQRGRHLATTPSARRSPTFTGVKRRFELTGTWNDAAIYDDYGHHPAEIAAVLAAARAGARGRAHRRVRAAPLHARARSLRRVLLPASATPTASSWRRSTRPASRRSTASTTTTSPKASARRGTPRSPSVESPRDLVPLLRRTLRPGDMVVCLGAGTSTEWAHALPDWLGNDDQEPRRAGGAH